jgi:hypothetical protein
MTYPIAIRAYDRIEIPTIELLEKTKYPIHIFIENEMLLANLPRKYKKHKIIITNTKGLTEKTNFIMNYYPQNTDILICNDDVKNIKKLGKNKLEVMNIREIEKLIEKGFEYMNETGAKLWGLYPVANWFYMEEKFSYCAFIVGNFWGIKTDSRIKADINVMCKEDHTILAENIKYFGKALRFDMYCADSPCYNPKGMSEYRTEEKEKKECDYLLKKYPYLFKKNNRRKNQLLVRNILK